MGGSQGSDGGLFASSRGMLAWKQYWVNITVWYQYLRIGHKFGGEGAGEGHQTRGGTGVAIDRSLEAVHTREMAYSSKAAARPPHSKTLRATRELWGSFAKRADFLFMLVGNLRSRTCKGIELRSFGCKRRSLRMTPVGCLLQASPSWKKTKRKKRPQVQLCGPELRGSAQ